MSQLNNVSNKGNGRGAKLIETMSKICNFFLDGFPNLELLSIISLEDP